MLRFSTLLLTLLMWTACTTQVKMQREAQSFLDRYSSTYQKLYYASAKAEWKANTYIVEGDTLTEQAVQKANEALAAFTGSAENIQAARDFLSKKENLTPLQVRQFETILYNAANNPQTVADLVSQRIKAETEQNKTLFGFTFKVDGREVSTNDIDEALKNETDLAERQKVWEASKEVGRALKPGLARLQKLRNQTVQALGYHDYFSYQVSDYGMTTEEMMAMNKRLIDEVMPLYRELHTYIRYTLAQKYGTAVPDYIPAHWLPNRWGQDWSALVHVKGLDLDGVLKPKGAEWLVKQAERFYVSMGFPSLPASFWEKSSLYPVPPDAGYKKNNHASAWHLDLDKDIRSLMSVIPTAEWYETTHHELGHIYYYISYSTPDVPILLRSGANRAFHEAVGSMMGLAAMQKPFLENLGLIPQHTQTDTMRTLLKEALNYIIFMPWSAGVMTEFEKQLYADNLSPDAYNATWWALKKKYQGIVPPTERGGEWCDAASKTHINNDAAQYYDYALSYVILFQIHDYIARHILQQPPQATNYYGNKEVGAFLKKILSKGATMDWRMLMRETLGEEISARPMLNYFKPLMKWLKKENAGHKYTL
ncbi:MAG: peptidase [Calditrichaeota bacterium]|nr:MAG: peptidase [Calditrichota bacterium]